MEGKWFKVEMITNGKVGINGGKSINGVNQVVTEETGTTGLWSCQPNTSVTSLTICVCCHQYPRPREARTANYWKIIDNFTWNDSIH